MKKLTATLCLTVAALWVAPAQAETVLYCQSELATGLIKKFNGAWVTGNFENRRWTVKFNNDFSELSGLYGSTYPCKRPNFKQNSGVTVTCSDGYGTGGQFIYNINKKRFLHSATAIYGYVNNESDFEVLYAGTCKKF